MEKKLNLSRHVCRMTDCQTGGVWNNGGVKQQTKPRKRLADDVEEWCNNDLHTPSKMATDRMEWRQIVKHVFDTNGLSMLMILDDDDDDDDSVQYFTNCNRYANVSKHWKDC